MAIDKSYYYDVGTLTGNDYTPLVYSNTIAELYNAGRFTFGQPLNGSNVWAVASEAAPISHHGTFTLVNGVLTINDDMHAPSNIRLTSGRANMGSTNNGRGQFATGFMRNNADIWTYDEWEGITGSFMSPTPSEPSFINSCDINRYCFAVKPLVLEFLQNGTASVLFGTRYLDDWISNYTGTEWEEQIDTGFHAPTGSNIQFRALVGVELTPLVRVGTQDTGTWVQTYTLDDPVEEFYTPQGITYGSTLAANMSFDINGGNTMQIRYTANDGYSIFGRSNFYIGGDKYTNFRAMESAAFCTRNDRSDFSGQFMVPIREGGAMLNVVDCDAPATYTKDNGFIMFNAYSGSISSGNGFATVMRYYSANELKSILASYGFYFLGAAPTTQSRTDEHMYLGHMNDDGTTDGTWTVGAANANAIQYTLVDVADTPAEATDPTQPPTPGDQGDDDTGDIELINTTSLSIIGTATGFTTLYGLSAIQVNTLGANLWSNFVANYKDNFLLVDGTDFAISMGDILQYFISLKIYPIDFFAKSTLLPILKSGSGITVGTGAAAIPIGFDSANTPYRFTNYLYYGSFGSMVIPLKYNDFMDYEPNATATLYVPFCGSVEIPVSIILNATLTCNYCIDFYNGKISAVLLKSGTANYPIAVLHGTIGIDLPITGNNAAQLGVAAEIQRANAVTNAITSGVQGISRGGLQAALSAGTSLLRGAMEEINNELRSQLSVQTLTSSSDLSAFYQPSHAYIQLRRRNAANPNTYATAIGEYFETSANLGTQSGFTVCRNPNTTGINATMDEQTQIRQLLESGVYL